MCMCTATTNDPLGMLPLDEVKMFLCGLKSCFDSLDSPHNMYLKKLEILKNRILQDFAFLDFIEVINKMRKAFAFYICYISIFGLCLVYVDFKRKVFL